MRYLIIAIAIMGCDPPEDAILPVGCPVNSTGGPRGLCDAPAPRCLRNEIHSGGALREGCIRPNGIFYGRDLNHGLETGCGPDGVDPCPRRGSYSDGEYRVECDDEGLVVTWGPIDGRGEWTCLYQQPSEPLSRTYPTCEEGAPRCGYPSALWHEDAGVDVGMSFDADDAGVLDFVDAADRDAGVMPADDNPRPHDDGPQPTPDDRGESMTLDR